MAEKIGDLKRVTITPPPGPGGRKPVRIFEDMVPNAGARSYDDVSGDDVIQPIIFSPVQGEGGLTWDTYFFNADSPGYSGAAKGPTATCSSVDTRRDILPESTRNWFNADGEFCAWGSAVSHNASPARHPRSLYGRTVQRLGRLVFASSIYIDEEGANLPWSLVLSAAFRGDWLYMVMAELGSLDYSTRPAESAVMGDAWASPHFSNTPFDYALYACAWYRRWIRRPNQVYFKAKDESHEVLWTGSLVRAYSAWTFNRAPNASTADAGRIHRPLHRQRDRHRAAGQQRALFATSWLSTTRKTAPLRPSLPVLPARSCSKTTASCSR